jgi:hypothetical protein
MPSPFPGMNPYLEGPRFWRDFHDSFIIALRDDLAGQVLQRGYFVSVNEQVYLREFWSDYGEPFGRPDISVGIRDGTTLTESTGGTATMAVPLKSRIDDVVPDEGVNFLEVIDRNTEEIITTIEVLSPSNKFLGKDRGTYVAKRRRILESPVHLVEIDLLRAGPRMPFADQPRCDYLVAVSRANSRPDVDMWPFGIRDPFPPIPVPLRDGEQDAALNLKSVLDGVYDRAGYGFRIYSHEPEPRLNSVDAAWAMSLIATGRT